MEKFKKREPHKQWTLERTYQRRSLVDNEIACMNRELNYLDRAIRHLINTVKPNLCKKLGNKWKYRRQLQEQIKEIKQQKTPV